MKIKAFLTAVLLTIGISANAQRAGLYQVFQPGLATFLAGATNTFSVGANTYTFGWPGTLTNLAASVEEYDDVGFTFSFATGSANSGSSVTLNAYRSYDGGINYEVNPGFVFSFTPGVAGTFTTNGNFHVPGVTHLAFVITNGANVPITSAALELNLKMPKRGAKQATQ